MFQWRSWNGLRVKQFIHNVLHGAQFSCQFSWKRFNILHLPLRECNGTLWQTATGGAPSAKTRYSTRMMTLENASRRGSFLIIFRSPKDLLHVVGGSSSPYLIAPFSFNNCILSLLSKPQFPSTFWIYHQPMKMSQTQWENKCGGFGNQAKWNV